MIQKDGVVANCDHLANLKFSKALPYAFTEHGAIMAASVLNSPRAVEASVFVVRAFVRMREIMGQHKEPAGKIAELENKIGDHDRQFGILFRAIKDLMDPSPPPQTRQIGF